MYRYQPLQETDCVVCGAGDSVWRTPGQILDQLIVAKAAYPLLADLGDRVPLLAPDFEEIQAARDEIRIVQQELIDVRKELKQIKKEKKQTKSSKKHNISTPLLKAVDSNKSFVSSSRPTGFTGQIRKFLLRIF